MVVARVHIDDFANRVLNVVKAQFGLKDKSEALNKFFHMFGGELLEPEVREEYVKKIINLENEHMAKHKNRRMSVNELDELCGV